MNYYEILEITNTASSEVIKAAYKALVKKYHPDNGGTHKELKSMELINEAYEILSDPVKRSEYDRTLVKGFVNDEEVNSNVNTVDKESSYAGNLGKIGRILKDIGKGIWNSMEQQRLEIENAYYEGMAMSDRTLVQEFKNSQYPKRKGYEKALVERGFLKKDDKNGQYVPTAKFYYYK